MGVIRYFNELVTSKMRVKKKDKTKNDYKSNEIVCNALRLSNDKILNT